MTLNELCDQYDDFLFDNDLPPMRADELLFEHDLTPAQCDSIEQFIEAWHVAEKEAA